MTAFLAELRATLRPRPGSELGLLPPLLVVLTVVTGLVDSVSYLVLGHVFVANMTGNVVLLGLALVGAPGFSAASSAIALAAFSAGSVLGGAIESRRKASSGHHLATAAAFQAVFLVGGSVLITAVASPRGGARDGLIVLLAIAMGIQGATARALGVADLTTSVLTQTITGLAADGPLGSRRGAHPGRRIVAVASMLAGAVAGAACVVHGHTPVALDAATALVVAVAVRSFAAARRDSPWAPAMR